MAFFRPHGSGLDVDGHTTAVEDGEPWAVHYAISLDARWLTLGARVTGTSSLGSRELELASDGHGRWRINGEAAGHVDGCLDVDLESSSLTNAFPVHRLGLSIGERADAPAVFVRALDVGVERLEQSYVRLPDAAGHQRYHYSAPRFDFECELEYDELGLLLEYPGIATRAA